MCRDPIIQLWNPVPFWKAGLRQYLVTGTYVEYIEFLFDRSVDLEVLYITTGTKTAKFEISPYSLCSMREWSHIVSAMRSEFLHEISIDRIYLRHRYLYLRKKCFPGD